MITEKRSKDIKAVLMNSKGSTVKSPYYEISDNGQMIFVVSPGQNSTEFNKTVGYFNTFPGVQTYLSLYGSGILLMQRNDENGEAKEFKVVTLSIMRQVNVPAGWGICLVNTGASFLVVLRSTLLEERFINEKPVLEKKGLAYFVVEKKGEIALEQNPSYKVHPQIATE